jgi:hypothetical protein
MPDNYMPGPNEFSAEEEKKQRDASYAGRGALAPWL